MYLKEKFSTVQIAKITGCGKTTICNQLKKFNIKTRSKTEALKLKVHPCKYEILKKDLVKYYYKNLLSPYQIAKIYNCCPSTIFYRMKKYNIPLRELFEAINLTIERRSKSIAKAHVAKSVEKRPRSDFDGTFVDKAYLIGFRLGDLYVAKRKYGETINVASSSTKTEQIELYRKLFKSYGPITINKYKNNYNFICKLNLSFAFLLKNTDQIDAWILNNKKYFLAFLAGYTDAEGHFETKSRYPRYFVGSYQKNIINTIHNKLIELEIDCPKPRIHAKEGYIDKRGVPTHHDLWGVRVNKMASLQKLIKEIKPYLKHSKRINDMFCVENKLNILGDLN